MDKKDLATRYYEMLEKIDRSEKAYKEGATAFLMRTTHNLNVSDLNRQCKMRGSRK